MDVTLHLGAHRTASTSFQHYMRSNISKLEQRGIGFWGPLRTRDGILTGVLPDQIGRTPEQQFAAAHERINQNLNRAMARGIQHLIISDENVIGTPRQNLREKRLYGRIGERMARYSQAFDGRITRLVLTIRSLDTYWGSAAAYGLARGHKVLKAHDISDLTVSRRQWRDVVTDLACAVPNAEIQVHLYEIFGGMPEQKLAALAGLDNVPVTHAREWLNRALALRELRAILAGRGEDPAALPRGEGRWHPFDRDHCMVLREAYADDLFWLRSGADGLATIIEETTPVKAGDQPAAGDVKRGLDDGKQDRRMA